MNNTPQSVVCGRSDIFDRRMESCSTSEVPAEASQSKKDNEEHAKECIQALELLRGHGKQSSMCTEVDFINGKAGWLERFIGRTFFDTCPEHATGRNALNKYCVDCDSPLCKYCLSLPDHVDHRILKMYRHFYKDVVSLDHIKWHIDCSLIQPYKCNKKMVLALTPLPHKGAKTKGEEGCDICGRTLFQPDTYSYCAISCKVEAFTKKKGNSRKRKGIPGRAPFF